MSIRRPSKLGNNELGKETQNSGWKDCHSKPFGIFPCAKHELFILIKIPEFSKNAFYAEIFHYIFHFKPRLNRILAIYFFTGL